MMLHAHLLTIENKSGEGEHTATHNLLMVHPGTRRRIGEQLNTTLRVPFFDILYYLFFKKKRQGTLFWGGVNVFPQPFCFCPCL